MYLNAQRIPFSVIRTQGSSEEKCNIEINIYTKIVNTLVCIAIRPVLHMKARHKIIRAYSTDEELLSKLSSRR